MSALRPRAQAQTQDLLARTLWGEAGDRPVRAIEAVAAVIATRARRAAAPGGPRHLGQGIAGVCRAPFQFPCWNPHHPRHSAMLEAPEGDPALVICRRVAARAMAGGFADPTGGATHYHPAEVLPAWAVGEVPNAEIGGLVFYRLAGA
jgi:spore germination cell wall hydrolase CwlJ-like protein